MGTKMIGARVSEETIRKVDELAGKLGQSRSAIIGALLNSGADNAARLWGGDSVSDLREFLASMSKAKGG